MGGLGLLLLRLSVEGGGGVENDAVLSRHQPRHALPHTAARRVNVRSQYGVRRSVS